MAPKRKAAVIDAVAAEADVVVSTRRKLPRRSTQKLQEQVIETLPVIKSETKIVEKPVKIRNARTSRAQAVPAEDEVGDDDKTLVVEKPAKVRAARKSKTQDVVPDGEVIDEDEALAVERGARRLPPVNSDILPLPWSGRLGYGLTTSKACLNTYLRTANPPVFSSRTCRIASILEHRHPLLDPSQPEHPTKNRPDKSKPADPERGLRFVQSLGVANAQDIVKMLRWNDKYGIKFMRLSSEMFPFASHAEYGYKLAPFAADALGKAGKVAAELGHRLTTHPGQFTQIGSPRKEVVSASFRDLAYHDELLSLLKLPPQQDRDAVMILHMGGTFGDKQATLDRFRDNYQILPQGVKNRLVLENDDVAWSVHDLLPICEELNIPLVLDYHHHNIVFDATSLREGTQDIVALYPRIAATWTRKGIKQKMHYSEPTAGAVTPRERRKHSPRVKVLPPCARDMDLMIEAKDKEQAVFELMRTYKLPGWDLANSVVPYERDDDEPRAAKKAADKKLKKEANGDDGGEENGTGEESVSAEDFGMGGPENRVYWPAGMEEWLKPRKKTSGKDAKQEVNSDLEEE
ncbi:UV-damage endonuclease [Akanthomyces lecanii RCEF 1005]|uniref:UV-damage endonuclease n=1 Tax=Akanthomyces lecanii RCEF 1005 TaxID=1081108 RepID=A0A168FQ59_CORDF|nr:UV-damage endonuclease [Akanthomyces lecanii RCEF 1005]